MKPLIPYKSGFEQDAFTGWRRILKYMGRAGIVAKARRKFWKRERQAAKKACIDDGKYENPVVKESLTQQRRHAMKAVSTKEHKQSCHPLIARLERPCSEISTEECEKDRREAAADIRALREWIRSEGDFLDTCTFEILREVCNGCRCHRMQNPTNQAATRQNQGRKTT